MKRLAVLTIGQAPRDDVVPHMVKFLPPEVQVIQEGLLDGFSPEEIEALHPEPGDYILVSRLADGRQVELGRSLIEASLRSSVSRLAQGHDVTVLFCTGELMVPSDGLVLKPDLVLESVIRILMKSGPRRMGLITPSRKQIPQTEEKWLETLGPRVRRLRGTAASPYSWEKEWPAAARDLSGVDFVVMDCMGYSPAMKAHVSAALSVPVILPVTLVGRILAEILDPGDST